MVMSLPEFLFQLPSNNSQQPLHVVKATSKFCASWAKAPSLLAFDMTIPAIPPEREIVLNLQSAFTSDHGMVKMLDTEPGE